MSCGLNSVAVTFAPSSAMRRENWPLPQPNSITVSSAWRLSSRSADGPIKVEWKRLPSPIFSSQNDAFASQISWTADRVGAGESIGSSSISRCFQRALISFRTGSERILDMTLRKQEHARERLEYDRRCSIRARRDELDGA